MKFLVMVSERIIRRTNKRNAIIALALLVATLVVMEASPFGKEALKIASGGRGMLDMRFAYNAEYVSGMFTALGTEGRILYARLLALDVAFAFAFMAFQSLVLSALIRRTGITGNARCLNLLPALRSALDLAENALLLALLALFPGTAGSTAFIALVLVASAVTSVKWIVYYAVIAALLILGARSFMRPKEKRA